MNTKIKAQKIYTKLLSNPKTEKEVLKFTMGFKTKDVFEAFQHSMKINFEFPEDYGWELISLYQAAKIANPHIKSLTTLTKYAQQGVFRFVDGKVYKQEVEKLMDMLNVFQILHDENIIGTEKIDGVDMFVLFPKKIGKLKQSENHQKLKALKKLNEEDWFNEFLSSVDLT